MKIKIPSKFVSKLDLSNCNLEKLPKEVLQLRNLKKLDLSNNKFKTIPRELKDLKRLEILDMSNNQINILYSSLGNMIKLCILNLNYNKIKSLPIQIENLTNLEVLMLACNRLESIPVQINTLTKLKKLSIAGNKFENFPLEILALKNLKYLWLNNLQIKEFPINEILHYNQELKHIYCFGQNIINNEVGENYIRLSKIKGNCYNELLKISLANDAINSPSIKLSKSKIQKKNDKVMHAENSGEKKNIFISYSHNDTKWLKEVQKNLKVLKSHMSIEIDVWDDTRIQSGNDWKAEIEKALLNAKIGILIISTDFLISDFIQSSELPQLLKKAEEEGTILLPLIVGHCLFTNIPYLNSIQSVNDPNKPLVDCTIGEQQKELIKLAKAVMDYY